MGVSPLVKAADLPGGGRRMIRHPKGVHGVWVNGVRVYAQNGYAPLEAGPGKVLREFSRA